MIFFKVGNRNGASTVRGGPCAPRENLGAGQRRGCEGAAAVDERAVTSETDKRHVENGAHLDLLETRIRGDRALQDQRPCLMACAEAAGRQELREPALRHPAGIRT